MFLQWGNNSSVSQETQFNEISLPKRKRIDWQLRAEEAENI